MKKVLFIHSAGKQGMHQGSNGLITDISNMLGNEYLIIHPTVANPEDPSYASWEVLLEKEFAALDNGVILIGHSLGGAILLKFLSEQMINCSISALFMIAAPYWGKDRDWQSKEYELQENFTAKMPAIPNMYLYHSSSDKIVPLNHLEHYKEKLPQAAVHIINGNEHYFTEGLPLLIRNIKGL